MNLPQHCDVAVIGSGPAGALAGGLLAAEGFSVVMLEKSPFPRPMVGESLIPHFWKYTDLLGASEAIAEENFVRKAGGTVMWNGTIRRMSFKDFGYERPALHVERDRFDTILQECAVARGVHLVSPAVATRVSFSPREDRHRVHFRVADESAERELECRYVIDASGQKALLARQLGLREIDEQFRFFSVWGYFRGASYVAADGHARPHEDLRTHPPTTFVTSLPAMADWAWSWHIALRDSTSVGLVLPLSEMNGFKASGLNRAEWLEERCRGTPILADLLADAELIPDSVATIRDYSYRATRAAGSGYFLAGDAAGFVDPIFSVGVVFSLYSAYSAAWALRRCLRDKAGAARYQALYDQQLRRRMETSRTLALPSYQPVASSQRSLLAGIGFESTNEQALMNVVATMTTRSGNMEALGVTPAAAADALGKITELDRIIW